MSLFTHKAVKEKLKARVALDGPTGSGKTWTALQWATILAQGAPIGVIDTEERSAAFYAPAPEQPVQRVHAYDPPYEFFHLPVGPPFDPRKLAQLIDAAAEDLGTDGVLVVDSLTHYWNGAGGTLEIVDDAAQRMGGGNSFAGWKEGTPAQRFMLDAIVRAPFHVIVTMRSKMEYVLEDASRNGKTIKVPRKVGMAPEQRSGIEYEFTVVADLDLEHRLTVSKSRCDVLADRVLTNGRSAEGAIDFAAWLNSGVQRITDDEALLLGGLFNAISDKDERTTAKREFVEQFGPPSELLADRHDEAREWITGRIRPASVVHGPLAEALDETAFDEALAPAGGME